ncbi:MAG: hypothetical protein F6K00_34765 [Leptolyngbya sp. SIOISBB]|nr:hypothetical protein [Leptolyngbya sp. SIOISBB]
MITTNWQAEQEQRKEAGKPDLPDAVSFILQVDPAAFDADNLKSFGIEVVADLEEGYIIGASTDTELSELRKKVTVPGRCRNLRKCRFGDSLKLGV